MNYIAYPVRPYIKAPLRCFSCQEYGHVAAVCRGQKRCAKCGKNDCTLIDCENTEPKCIHCGGNHLVGSVNCPRRQREEDIKNLRTTNGLSYAEAAKRVKPKDDQNIQRAPEEARTSVFEVDKKSFLAFMAMVVNCSAEVSKKSERIDMILEAARRFLSVDDISGEDLYQTLQGHKRT